MQYFLARDVNPIQLGPSPFISSPKCKKALYVIISGENITAMTLEEMEKMYPSLTAMTLEEMHKMFDDPDSEVFSSIQESGAAEKEGKD